MNDKIKELQRQIETEQHRINSCEHTYGEAFYDPETVQEPTGSHLVQQGSDVWCEADGYRSVQKPRWTRVCTRCGNKQHTYTQRVVSTIKEPDFT
jgi:hypothetical protein